MLLGQIGLAGAYVCLIVVVLWIFIRSSVHVLVKTALIAFAVWYGLALFYAVPRFMGWPTGQSVPGKSEVLAIRIQEPRKDKKESSGAIYVWLGGIRPTDGLVERMLDALNPQNAFSYYGEREPRAYKLPYTLGLHEKVNEAMKQKSGTPGTYLTLENKKAMKVEEGQIPLGDEDRIEGGDDGEGYGEHRDDQLVFDVVVPFTNLRKE